MEKKIDLAYLVKYPRRCQPQADLYHITNMYIIKYQPGKSLTSQCWGLVSYAVGAT